ncbi:oligosaccharide flippase family protein [Marisediminicola sp. LYQ85]|uniref:oligosaccharide flippase family protein n=1 Tax=Marisediminicola sp. LYQ85 TaxID=3391062 RepID=UPI0039836496
MADSAGLAPRRKQVRPRPPFARVFGYARRFGWLPAGQGVVLLISIGGFAVLARVLGPEPYAKFAVILFLFTAASLLVDLSPQGFMVVRRGGREVARAASRMAAISAVAGGILLAVGIVVANGVLLDDPITLLESILLELAMVGQMATQVARARLVLRQQYKTMALVDVASNALGMAAAIVIALDDGSGIALTIQLVLTAVIRFSLTIILGRERVDAVSLPEHVALLAAIRYGLRVIPLNLAGYLSRSLDSGLLPGIIPAAAAAGYARSYQIVVVPLTQVQLSLGPALLDKLSRSYVSEGRHDAVLGNRILRVLEIVAVAAGLVIIAVSPIIQAVLFGPGWPMVNVMISAMACMLPSLALGGYCSWLLQITSRVAQTLAHFGAMMVTPLVVIGGAIIGGTQGALVGLVGASGLQSVILVILHRQLLPAGRGKLALRLVVVWVVMAALFTFVATSSGFWGYDF